MADSMYDPKKRNSKTYKRTASDLFRIYFLEVGYTKAAAKIVELGKAKFGSNFHCFYPKAMLLRPFFVKPATRRTCLCRYVLSLLLIDISGVCITNVPPHVGTTSKCSYWSRGSTNTALQ